MASPIKAISLQWCVSDQLRKHAKLSALLDKVTQLHRDTRVIEDTQLETFGIRRLAALDIDQETIDLEPIFFQPLPVNSAPWRDFDRRRRLTAVPSEDGRAQQEHQYVGRWMPMCRGDDDETHLCPGPYHEAGSRLGWFHDALKLIGPEPGILEKNTDWKISREPCDCDHHRLPAHYGDPLPEPEEDGEGAGVFKYDLDFCFLPTEELDQVSIWTPRIAGATVQSHRIRGDTLLRSEIHSALHLLIHQLEHGIEDYHYTIPVLIYSFHQDKTARVTQFHFNGEHLLFRQSRLLDLNADEPTDDAYLLLRWMISLPIGETRFTLLPDLTEAHHVETDEGGQKDAVPIVGAALPRCEGRFLSKGLVA